MIKTISIKAAAYRFGVSELSIWRLITIGLLEKKIDWQLKSTVVDLNQLQQLHECGKVIPLLEVISQIQNQRGEE